MRFVFPSKTSSRQLRSARALSLTGAALALGFGTPAQDSRPQLVLDIGQRIAWLREHAVRLAPAASREFEDLEPLRGLLKGKRVVMLGEPTHGDGAVFEHKARLLRWLHAEMGFEVLAVESGLYDCLKVQEALAREVPAATAVQLGIFPVWTRSAQFQGVLELLDATAKTDRPLLVSGFDCKLTGAASRDSLATDLQVASEQFLGASQDARLQEALDRALACVRFLTSNMSTTKQRVDPTPYWLAALATLELEFAQQRQAGTTSKLVVGEAGFWEQLMRSLATQLKQQRQREGVAEGFANEPINLAEQLNPRDAQMAENLIWLIEHGFPNQKIVVWSATMHIQDVPDQLNTPAGIDYTGVLPMGSRVRARLGKGMYSLGFTAFRGETGLPWQTPTTVPPAPKNSFEDLCQRADLEHALIDFSALPKEAWLHDSMIMRPLGFVPMRGRWTDLLDGMFFLQTTTPSLDAAKAPSGSATAKSLLVRIQAEAASVRSECGVKRTLADKHLLTLAVAGWLETEPDVDAVRSLEAAIDNWALEEGLAEEPALAWRVAHLRGTLAAARQDDRAEQAALNEALDLYHITIPERPPLTSRFHQLANQLGLVQIKLEGFDAALKAHCSRLAKDPRFQALLPAPWFARADGAGGRKTVREAIHTALTARLKAFPAQRVAIERQLAALDRAGQ